MIRDDAQNSLSLAIRREAAISLVMAMGFLTSCPTASAESDLTAGVEGGPSNGYAYVSPQFGIPFTDTSSFVIAPAGSYNYYDVHESGGITKVKSPGVSIGLDYKFSDDLITFDFGPGAQVLWEGRDSTKKGKTNLTPVGWTASGDLSWQVLPTTSIDLSASYEQTDRYYWTHADVEERIVHLGPFSWLVGPEGKWEGNNQFTQFGGGGVTEFVFDPSGTSLQLHAGYVRVNFSDSTSTSRPYAGIDLDQRF